MIGSGDKGNRAVGGAGRRVRDQDLRLVAKLFNHANSLISLRFFEIQHLKQTCSTRYELHAMRCIAQHFRHRRVAIQSVHDELLGIGADEDVCICHAKVGIKQNGAPSMACHGKTKVHCDACLAYAALAACDHDRLCHISLVSLFMMRR